MLIVTAKVPRRKLALWGLAAAALCCCLLLMNLGALRSARGTQTSAATAHKGVKTNEDRLAFLSSFGWQVDSQPLATEELILPETFDESMTDYLMLQNEQGFDLTQYAGKRVKRYTYSVTNHPTGRSNVQVNLLLYKNTVVGAEVLCPELDGFLHGLAMPAQ